MIDVTTLFRAVLLLFCLMIPGFILKKARLVDDRAPLAFTNTILYITQPALLFVGFFRPYDREIMHGAVAVLIFTFAVHAIFLLMIPLFFRKMPKKTAKVYRFGSVFANVGYMGIPLITMILGAEAAIYASVYTVGFNFYSWSVGSYMYSEDRSYISVRKMFINAATVPTLLGILVFVTDLYSYIPSEVSGVIADVLNMLKDTVAPMSMMIIGMRLADLKLKGAFKDAGLYIALSLRLIVFPITVFGVLFLCKTLGFYNELAFAVTLICSATPAASLTSMFAEKFNADTVTASKLVSVSTLLSLVTMPLIVMLLQLL